MRFTDFKIVEASIGRANINSVPGYIDAVNELLKDPNHQFEVSNIVDKKEVKTFFKANPGQQISSLEDAISGQGTRWLKPRGGEASEQQIDQIQVKNLYKSADIKRLSGKGGDGDIVFNAGEVAEGIHAVAAFVRLIKRPSEQISLADLYPIIERLNNGKTLVLKAKEVDSDIADEFRVTVSLKPQQWDAFKQLDKIVTTKKLKGIASNIIDDANQESGRYADMYEKNGKFDSVSVIGDGVSGETETKTDINFDNETERKYKGYSIKAGSTGQIHQVGGGATTLPAEDRFDIINNELLGVHGRARLVDISGVKDEFVKLWNSGKVFAAYRRAYEETVNQLNQNLDTNKEENDFIKNLILALKYWMRRDEEGVVLKQFTGTGKGTYILDAEKLDELQEKGLNLVAKMASTAEPTLRIIDTESNKALIEIRAKGEEKANGNYYFRNLINKGPLFVKLTDVSKAS
jgi:hypothetical protein